MPARRAYALNRRFDIAALFVYAVGRTGVVNGAEGIETAVLLAIILLNTKAVVGGKIQVFGHPFLVPDGYGSVDLAVTGIF